MKKLLCKSLLLLIVFLLSACNAVGTPTTAIGTAPVVKLIVETQSGSTTFSQAGEIVNYNYVITNTGSTPLAGPVLVVDASKLVTCPGDLRFELGVESSATVAGRLAYRGS
jgi:hypothetical protein